MCESVHGVPGLILFKYGVHCGALDHIHLYVGLLNIITVKCAAIGRRHCVFVRTMHLCDYSGVVSHSELSIGGTQAGVWRFQPSLHVNDLAETPFQPIQILQYFMLIS